MTKRTYIILLAALVLAPLTCLPGLAGLGVMALLEALSIGLLLALLYGVANDRSNWHAVPGIVPLAVLACFLFFQAVPLPPFLLRLISPQTWSVYAETIWVARPGAWMPLSVSLKATLTEFFRVVAFAAVYLVAFQLHVHRDRLKQTLPLLTAFAGGIALFAIGVFLLANQDVFSPQWGTPSLFRDNIAGLLAMAFPVAMANYMASRPEVSHLSLRERVLHILRQISSRPHVLVGLACLCLVLAIVLSRSWSAILGSLGALLVFSLLLMSRRRGRQKEIWGGLVLLALVFLFGLAVPEGMQAGSSDTAAVVYGTADQRRVVRQDSIEIFCDFPLFGTGAGTFEQVYTRYRSLPGEGGTVEHARNDLLETLVETGLVGVSLSAWFLLAVFYRGYLAWRRRHNRTSVYLYIGGVAGLTAIILHGWDSSTLQLFVTGFFLLFFCALSVAAAKTSFHRSPPGPDPVPPRLLRWSLSIGVTVLLLNLVTDAGSLSSRALYGETLASLGQAEGPVKSAAAKAALLDPLAADYRYLFADATLASGERDKAVNRFGTALRLAPLNAEYLQRLGLVVANDGRDETAEKLLQAGVNNDPSNPERHRIFAFWLLSKGKKELALEHIRQAVYWGPNKTWDYLSLMASYGLSEAEMRRILPERSVPVLAFADYLASIGQSRAATQSYQAAVRHAMGEKNSRPETFQRAAEFFAESDRHAEALEIILTGLKAFPKNLELRLAAAKLYERLGIVYRAIQEYRGVLAFDPENEEARERLNALVEDQL